MDWYSVARYIAEMYPDSGRKPLVDFDREYFICPECGEEIFSDDYEEVPAEFCPICGAPW
jgi:rubrerythrin